MKFIKLKLNNYRIYYGSQEINLDIPPQKPPYRKNLILIGGLNGSGKTTIYKAIKLALFARRGMSKKEYDEFLGKAINDIAFLEGIRSCSVSLTFENDDEKITIEVILTYNDKKELISEKRKLYKYNKKTQTNTELTSITHDQFNQFIDERIPLDAADFFLFDGEEIQQLVEKQDNGELKSAIQQIFSLNTIDTLKKDLNNVHREYDKQYTDLSTDEDHKTLLIEINQLKDHMEKIQNQNNQLNMEREALNARQALVKKARSEKLERNNRSKTLIIQEIAKYEKELDYVIKEIKSYTEQIHTILLNPFIIKLKDRLSEEKEYHLKRIRVETQYQTYEKFMDQLINELDKISFPILKTIQLNQLKEAGKKAWATINNIEETKELENFQFLHDLSQSDYDKLNRYPIANEKNIKNLIATKIQLENKLKQLNGDLSNAPDEVDLTPEENELAEINQKIGQITQQLKSNKELLMSYQEELNSKQKKLANIEKTLNQKNPLERKRDYTKRLINATQEFLDEFTKLKYEKVRYEFREILDRLIRKNQDFFDVEFDEEKYTFRIYDESGNQINLQDRSAGEKQIIALSFIWALTKTAGFPLPFVIDTPFGRLDSIHRTHLVQHFLNQLSDQVIILSTDTEVNEEFQQALKNYLVREYYLNNIQDKKHTEINEGYFTFEKK